MHESHHPTPAGTLQQTYPATTGSSGRLATRKHRNTSATMKKSRLQLHVTCSESRLPLRTRNHRLSGACSFRVSAAIRWEKREASRRRAALAADTRIKNLTSENSCEYHRRSEEQQRSHWTPLVIKNFRKHWRRQTCRFSTTSTKHAEKITWWRQCVCLCGSH